MINSMNSKNDIFYFVFANVLIHHANLQTEIGYLQNMRVVLFLSFQEVVGICIVIYVCNPIGKEVSTFDIKY